MSPALDNQYQLIDPYTQEHPTMNRHIFWIIAIVLLGQVPTAFGQGEKKVQIKLGKDKGTFDFLIGDELITRYHTVGYSKPIFWPVNAPGDIPLTRNYPPPEGQAKDHPHQKSAWFCHGDVIPEGMELKSKIKGVAGVDFWSEAKGHGEIYCTSLSGLSLKDTAVLTTQNEWRTAEGEKIMDETRVIRLYDLGKARLI